MFSAETYIKRREELKKKINRGVLLFLGNEESPMNYKDNPYHFRQDSTFLYYFGREEAGLSAVIDVESGDEILFGYDFGIDEVIWMGPQKSLKEKGGQVGIKETRPIDELAKYLAGEKKKGRTIHYLPPYRSEHVEKLCDLLNMDSKGIRNAVSETFIKAVVAQRSIKEKQEITEIEEAHAITREMHLTAIKMAKPGIYERDIAGIIEGIALAKGSGVSFPIILSVRGETLHNHYHGNQLKKGDLVINDSGAESINKYAADITRTIPVGGVFDPKQKDIYETVLLAQTSAIAAIGPGKPYLDIHLLAARIMAEGLKSVGLMQGNIEDAVIQGAHALFFPHGLGHMMGLDVHDMENLGEEYVGYDETVQRSTQFGLAYLRLAKKLRPGYVLTVEPGIYFIPALIELWEKEKKFIEYINYEKVKEYIGFGGIRIEDDVEVTEGGYRLIGKEIPKKPEDIRHIYEGN